MPLSPSRTGTALETEAINRWSSGSGALFCFPRVLSLFSGTGATSFADEDHDNGGRDGTGRKPKSERQWLPADNAATRRYANID